MRILLDAHLSPRRSGEPLRAQGHDVLALAEEPALRVLSDAAVLHFAAAERRITITCDCPHFDVLAREWASVEREHAGLVLVWSLGNDRCAEIVDGVGLHLRRRPRQEDWLSLVLTL